MRKRTKEKQRLSGLTYELSDAQKANEEDRFFDISSPEFPVDPSNIDVFDPGKSQRIPKGGAWVMITRRLPPMERQLNEHIRVGRVFFVEHEPNADDFGFMPDGRYKLLCRSPWGDVHLWPYEYSSISVETILRLWQDGEVKFHPVNMEAGRLNDIVFYARSRGIGIADALVIALGTLTGPVGWFEPSTAELAEDCEAMEERVHRWRPSRGNAVMVCS